jgi:hypothetical protein
MSDTLSRRRMLTGTGARCGYLELSLGEVHCALWSLTATPKGAGTQREERMLAIQAEIPCSGGGEPGAIICRY